MFGSIFPYPLQCSHFLIKDHLQSNLLMTEIFFLAWLVGQYETNYRYCLESKKFWIMFVGFLEPFYLNTYKNFINYLYTTVTFRCAATAYRIADKIFAHIIIAGSPIPFEEYTALVGFVEPSSLSRVTLNDLGTSFTVGT